MMPTHLYCFRCLSANVIEKVKNYYQNLMIERKKIEGKKKE